MCSTTTRMPSDPVVIVSDVAAREATVATIQVRIVA